ncbi:MAG: acyltransferase [Coriobacteriales bacterium]|nr:acyltransferase [Coriobacteriales bacterium]
MHPERNGTVEVLLVIALQATLVGTLVFGTKGLPRGEWNDNPLSLGQAKALQGFLALCIVFHHCAQQVFHDRWGSAVGPSGLEVMALIGFAFVGYFFFCSGYGLYQSCQRKRDYLHGFLRHRALPLILVYYACNTAYLVGRLAMGETFGPPRVACLLCGIELANPNSWFVVALPIMYLVFYAAKRDCPDDGLVVRRLFVGVVVYVMVGIVVRMAFSGVDRYMVFLGKWWYNTAILFPLGYLFGSREREAWAWMRGGYRRQVACSVALFVGCFLLALVFGVGFSLSPVAFVFEILCAIGFTWGLLLLSLRRKASSRLLSFYGGLTLELYLMHGFFVNLFYRPFYDKDVGIVTIGSPAAYILVVLACGTALALLFRQVTKRLPGPRGPRQAHD